MLFAALAAELRIAQKGGGGEQMRLLRYAKGLCAYLQRRLDALLLRAASQDHLSLLLAKAIYQSLNAIESIQLTTS